MSNETVLSGTPVVQGMAYAPAVWALRPSVPPTSAPQVPQERRQEESEKYLAAANTVSKRLMDRALATIGQASDVLMMSSSLVKDRGLRKEVLTAIESGTPAVQAVVRATDKFVDLFSKTGGLMAERVSDLRDLRDRVIAELEGRPEPGIPTPSEPSVLLADDLSPADTAGLDPNLIVAMVTELGGPTSHTAIIARQLGIPCIVAVPELGRIEAGEVILVDASTGTITRNSDPEKAKADVERDVQWRKSVAQWKGPARTASGEHVELLVNVQDGASAKKASESEAEGVGLFRTELCFLNAKVEPSTHEQVEIYRPVLEAYESSKVVIRTLDAGSDKPIAYANLEEEDNPALGVRGLRIAKGQPALLDHQLDAIAQAAHGRTGKTWVMAPMVSTIAEAEGFVEKCHERGLTGGIMVEVPAVAILASSFLKVVDFVSIGTNDLTQYVMAADRLSPKLAELTDPWQPAVLSMIARVAAAGRELGKPVGVCGEAAADPVLACVLVGMGVTSLSMAASAVSQVGAQLGAVTLDQCKGAAAAVADVRDAKEARAKARVALGIVPE